MLSRIGLLAHPYEACVFHGSFRSHKVVIACYVDDLLICHDGDSRFPEYFIAELKKYFKGVKLDTANPLTYIGMEIHRSNTNYHVTMTKYEQDIVEYCHLIDESVVCPNTSDLFEAETNPQLLTGDDISRFHTIAAKLLYLAKRTRGDILTPVSVMCSRVKEPSKNDLIKLLKIVRYISGTWLQYVEHLTYTPLVHHHT